MKTIFLYANPEFDDRYKCGISKLYRIFTKEYGYNLEFIDDEFLLKHSPSIDSPDVIAIAGGDGTVHRIINTIPSCNLPKYHIGIIPGGTANEFARSINLPTNYEEATKIVAEHKNVISRKIGIINDKYLFATGFLYGIACKVLQDTSVKSKMHLGAAAYQLPGLFSISNYTDFIKKFNVNSTEFETGYLLINNASLISKNIPANGITDEDINLFSFVYLYPDLGTGDFLRLIINNQIGANVLLDPGVHYVQKDWFTLNFEDPINFMLDGEVYEMPAPLKFEHFKHELKFIV